MKAVELARRFPDPVVQDGRVYFLDARQWEMLAEGQTYLVPQSHRISTSIASIEAALKTLWCLQVKDVHISVGSVHIDLENVLASKSFEDKARLIYLMSLGSYVDRQELWDAFRAFWMTYTPRISKKSKVIFVEGEGPPKVNTMASPYTSLMEMNI